MAWRDVDLFGDPIVSHDRGPGRPRIPKDVEKSLLISGLAALGLCHVEIAARVGLSAPTLRRIYSKELGANPATAKRRALLAQAGRTEHE